ncbi:uncharacterized protein A4U43_C03F1100 [Asparagus officinalis]|uniref:Uncharacterized protein n=1 Tax=Asparagus officinalis TaxID=4686 RepID=A0A5P1F6C1_ASPOF|nr:uncharacterized protein A4U43_C03F1100 [Asparagus officinalis]
MFQRPVEKHSTPRSGVRQRPAVIYRRTPTRWVSGSPTLQTDGVSEQAPGAKSRHRGGQDGSGQFLRRCRSVRLGGFGKGFRGAKARGCILTTRGTERPPRRWPLMVVGRRLRPFFTLRASDGFQDTLYLQGKPAQFLAATGVICGPIELHVPAGGRAGIVQKTPSSWSGARMDKPDSTA